MNITIPINSRAAVRALNKIQKKQLPFAIASALTFTAKQAAKDSARATTKYLDRPTPFTKKGFGITPAKKTKHQAFVFIKDQQAKYMRYQISGGPRLPKRKAILVPTRNLTDINRYGNMQRSKIKQMLRHPAVFSANIKGIGGVWHRQSDGKLRLLVAWEPKVKYRKRYPFKRIVQKSVRKNYERNFKRSLANALRTAR